MHGNGYKNASILYFIYIFIIIYLYTFLRGLKSFTGRSTVQLEYLPAQQATASSPSLGHYIQKMERRLFLPDVVTVTDGTTEPQVSHRL